jgi:glycosyltransferase involved in cell wall biosynthesis
LRVCWAAYGDLGQPTGGYVYDRLVVSGLRARGDDVTLADLACEPSRLPAAADGGAFDAVVGDALCVRELGPIFEGTSRGVARVLLVHHLTSWEVEHTDDVLLRAVEARAIAASDRLVVTGDATGARLAAEHPGRAIDVILPGADRLVRLPHAPDDRGRARLVFIGSLIARKRVPLLLDAIEEASDPRLALTLVGDADRDPEHAAAVRARVEASRVLRAAVRFAGIADEAALSRVLSESDALVLPSSLEGYGMVLTEALHAGVPVFVSRPTAIAAGLVGSPAAVVCDDAKGLAALLRRFAGDGAMRAALRAAAEAAVWPRWSDTVRAFGEALGRARAAVAQETRGPVVAGPG